MKRNYKYEKEMLHWLDGGYIEQRYIYDKKWYPFEGVWGKEPDWEYRIAECGFIELQEPEQDCKTHPDAPHGFCRNASLSEDRYVCECEYWEPPQRQWVWLTGDEVWECVADAVAGGSITEAAEKIQAKLREKNI